ncbi:DUF7594 domain-containing protein [Paenibacillus whitsoniae]|uniref:DNRLRE domain-containing protein n=1 Tax=Paenibacillus whitsoniae TaxID=2496558 RepID=A0A3S0BVD6_9BACL|nr:DNRLRE domain-containing protein [Paenibacillus whitsoniae]RTE09205.1 DNRLRE domain-containing protein [Paenibacillus whitsoniae]
MFKRKWWKKAISGLAMLSLVVATLGGALTPIDRAYADTTTTLAPEADAYINNQNPNVSYSNNSPGQLLIRESSTVQNRAYMRFNVNPAKNTILPAVSKIKSVKLRVTSVNATSNAVTTYVYGTEDNWNEYTAADFSDTTGTQNNYITWNNKPASMGLITSFPVAATNGVATEVDLTSYVKQQMQGDGLASISLQVEPAAGVDVQKNIYSRHRSTVSQQPVLVFTADTDAPSLTGAVVSSDNKQVTLSFSENIFDNTSGNLKDSLRFATNGTNFQPLGAGDTVVLNSSSITINFATAIVGATNKIRLLGNAIKDNLDNILTTDTTTIALQGANYVPIYANNQVIPATADARVDSGATNIDSNFGTEATSVLKEGGGAFNRRVLVKFDLANANTFNSAKLRLYFTETLSTVDPISIYAIGDAWQESGAGGVTYNTQPEQGALLGTVPVGITNGWYEWDVTNYIQSQVIADGTASILVVGSASNSNRVVANRESGATGPQLLLHYDTQPPVYTSSVVSNENRTITLNFDDNLVNNKADAAALKSAISLAADGVNATPLSAGDQVTIANKQLTVVLQNRLMQQGAKLIIAGNTLKDTNNNILTTELRTEALQYDTTAPNLVSSASLDTSNKIVTITGDEPLFSNAVDAASLKAAVTFAANGTTYQSLGSNDTVTISGGVMKITLENPLNGTANTFKLAGNTLKDAAGNVITTAYTTLPITADSSAPELQSTYIYNFNKKINLTFNENVVNALSDITALKAALTISNNGGSTYQALPTDATVATNGNKIVLSFSSALTGNNNRIQLAAGAIKDASNNVIPNITTSALFAAGNVSYPYATTLQSYLDKAMLDTGNITFTNADAASDGGVVTTTEFASIAQAIASGNRSPELIERYVSTMRKMITNGTNMPNLQGGLDSRAQAPMVYALALLWNDEGVMSQFTSAERSKFVTFMKAALVSTAYTISDFDENGNARPGNRTAMNGDTNTWIGTGPNYWEPNLTMFYSAAFVLGTENVKSILQNYDHTAFIAELNALGLSSIKTCFEKTIGFSSLTDKAAKIKGTITQAKWSFKGVSLDQFLSNPVELFEATQSYTWTHSADEGDYIGQTGMAHEFASTDASGPRESLSYVSYGVSSSNINLVLMKYFGYMDSPGNEARVEHIMQLLRVGVSDFYLKGLNGYYTQSWLGTHTEQFSGSPYVALPLELLASTNLINVSIFNESFNYASAAAMATNWNVSGSGVGISQETIIPYNTKQTLTSAIGATPKDPEEKVLQIQSPSGQGLAYTTQQFANVNYYAWVQMSNTTSGEVGLLGRVTDASHYYKASYANGQLTISKVSGSTVQTLVQKAYTLTSNKAYRFKLVFTGSTIRLYVNAQQELTTTDSSYATGAIGVFADHATGEFDGIVVQNATTPAPQWSSITVGNGKLTLNYNAVPGAISYKVQYGTTSGNYTNTVVTGSTNPVITGLTNNTTYYFAVSAISGAGESPLSQERSLAPSAPTAVTPQLTSVISDGNSMVVNFTTNPINTSYMIKIGEQSGTYTRTVSGVTYSGYAVTLPASHTPYYFVVVPTNDKGDGTSSNELSASGNNAVLYSNNFNDGKFADDWFQASGSYSIDNNGTTPRLKADGSSFERMWLKKGQEWKDYAVTVKALFTPTKVASNQIFVLGRASSTANYYLTGYEMNTGSNSYTVYIKKKQDNVTSVLVQKSKTITTNVEHVFRSEFVGNQIKLYIDGVLELEATDSTQSTTLQSGSPGFLSTDMYVYHDDLVVESIGGLAKPVITSVVPSDGQATVKFGAIASASGYLIKYGDASHKYTNVMTVQAPLTEGNVISGLDVEKTYYVTVSAIKNDWESENAAEVAPLTIASSVANVLEGAATINAGEEVAYTYHLNGVAQSAYPKIYAQDILISYDTSKLEFVSAASIKPNYTIVGDPELTPGQIRIKMASIGEAGVVTGNENLLTLRFRGKSSATASTTVITAVSDITDTVSKKTTVSGSLSIQLPALDKTALSAMITSAQTLLANAVEGTYAGQYPAGSKNVLSSAITAAIAVRDNTSASQSQVTSAVTTLEAAIGVFTASVHARQREDVNGIGGIDIVDLGLVAKNYGKTSAALDWQTIKNCDINDDGIINIVDLAAVALKF